MRAGPLRHTISLEEKTDTTDGMGGFTEVWATVSGQSAIPAQITPLSSDERIGADKVENRVSHRIKIRYRPGITTKMRAKWGTRYFNILSIINFSERNIMLEMLTEERT